MLEVRNVSVDIGGNPVLKNIELSIAPGDVMVMFGPNGSGKSTLVKAIMGFGGYSLAGGSIMYKGRDLKAMRIDERVALGIGIMYQHPPKVRGVRLRQLSRFLCGDEKKIEDLTETLSLEDLVDRDINFDLSGGEMKRSELFQISLQEPDLLLLDEPESGVDIENISLMGKVLNGYLKKKERSALIITHTGYILDYVEARRGCLMIDGQLWCAGRPPKEMFEEIKNKGYGFCRECHGKK